ncbi:MAG TPA: EFR1 family ferrodoxin [Candidatus Edwardsbacteria bacterium]|nr:EFR1 family ferrodoxin [Candidatus Edwardsbacteria bacterium]
MPNGTAVIRYFTGTGNTKRIAERIGAELAAAGFSADVRPIADGASVAAADCYVFCSPVYALGLPRVFRRYLASLPAQTKAKPAMLVVTAGNPEHTGWALRHGRELLDVRNYRVSVSEAIHMPDNWTPFLPAPSQEIIARRLAAGDELATRLARDFLTENERHRPFSLAAMTPIGSWLVYQGFHAMGVNHLWHLFTATKACTSCGLCARICPLQAIAMDDGRPRWTKSCEQCCRCFNLCPARAIEQLDIIGRGSKRARYREPGFQPEQKG